MTRLRRRLRHRVAARAVGVVAVLFAAHGAAHDLVFHPAAQADAPLVARYGHPGDWQPIEATKLLEVGRATGAALVPAATITPIDGRLDIAWTDAGGGLVAARYDNGFWTQRGDGRWVNARRTAIADAKAALSSFKFAKAWTGPRGAGGYDATVGHRLELSLLDDPATLAPGGTARVQVLWEGRPMTGA
ncbi:MAG: DUF4198 domain-containing protein, partial [Burkholderiales bacterium]|nr:DUF4198 domain-containing protein [Burkholderiales bacterium]